MGYVLDETAFDNAIGRAREATDAEIDLAVASAHAAAERKSSAAPMTTWNIYSPMGSIQTGAYSSAHVIQNLSGEERAQLASALTGLRDAVGALPAAHEEKDLELLEMVNATLGELDKSKPNGSLVTSLLSGVATAVQTVGALEPAYQALKVAAGAIGIVLP